MLSGGVGVGVESGLASSPGNPRGRRQLSHARAARMVGRVGDCEQHDPHCARFVHGVIAASPVGMNGSVGRAWDP